LTILNVRHTTVYRYGRPVRLGDHRLMLRPRDSHDLRLIETSLNLSPRASIRWVHDVFGNSIALASFTDSTTELRIESIRRLQTFPAKRPAFQIDPDAVSYPVIYSPMIASILVDCSIAIIPLPPTGWGHGRVALCAATQPIRWLSWPT
jgi:transglutaminase-like putative cysteine protease